MFRNPGDKWIDISYQVRLEEMLSRTEERFASSETLTLVDKKELVTKPYDVIDRVFAKYPEGRTAQLLIEDQDFFVGSVCGRFDRKPVNFISRIDQMFKRNFKGDSLWYSECLNAVVENDAERTFIIYGPVAAQHVNSKEETIKDVLDEINNGVKQRIAPKQSSAAPLVQDVGSWLQTFIASKGIKISMSKAPSGEQLLQFALGEQVFDVENLCMLLTRIDIATSIETGYISPGSQSGWMMALFHPLVVRGDKHAPSPIHGVLQPVPGMTIALASSGNHLCI
jgi:enoyl reductase-like protein